MEVPSSNAMHTVLFSDAMVEQHGYSQELNPSSRPGNVSDL